ncbi:hypothetical protein [Kitasatospora sp. SUK 42]|uniref:hypothetical protein n=1 Tax=Kitasatospora sp. SUK 42 TaxID=1588882 RepID=UPI0018CB7507|nr:hypothetical protein [Kitasatospora sp. SUK 42]MBV2153400.1 hypothetical protein [Kitasatospora sp. SUK 42]
MRLVTGLVLLSLLLFAIAVVALGALAVLRMPHRSEDLTAAPTPDRDRDRDRQPVA